MMTRNEIFFASCSQVSDGSTIFAPLDTNRSAAIKNPWLELGLHEAKMANLGNNTFFGEYNYDLTGEEDDQ